MDRTGDTSEGVIKLTVEDLKRIVSFNIRRRREALGMTQEKLAECAGLSTIAISKLENMLEWPKAETMVALSSALNVDPWRFLFDGEQAHSIPFSVMAYTIDQMKECMYEILKNQMKIPSESIYKYMHESKGDK